MNPTLVGCLDDLSRRIDENEEASIRRAWEAFLDGGLTQGWFTPPSRRPKPSGVAWPDVAINDALHDPQLMLLQQFAACSRELARGGNAVLNVRCNYGVSIMASQFGCEVIEMPREQGDLPTPQPLGAAAIPGLLERGVPDLRAGQGGQVFDTASMFLEVLERYPVLGRWVELYHPDTQGPMDTAELLYGSEVFLAFYDEPERVHALLDLTCDHYIHFLRKWLELVPPRGVHLAHWGMMFKGRIMLRDDSLMNLSPDLCEEFVLPREERALRELGGGAIHFCGRGDHFIDRLSRLQGLTAINLSQPDLNDMGHVFRCTIDRGVRLIGLDPHAAEGAGRDLKGRVHANAGGQTIPRHAG